MKKFFNNIDITKLFIFIGAIDFSILTLNTIYHFIIHEFYKSLLGKLFLILFIIIFGIIILLGKLNLDQNDLLDESNLTIFLLSVLGILYFSFIIGVTIATYKITTPIFLIIQWLFIPICFIIIICNNN